MHLHRHTLWQLPTGEVLQAACARLEPDTFDVLAEATEVVGDRGDASGCLVLACQAAGALADGQYRGQQSLLD